MPVAQHAGKWLKSALGLIYPEVCQLCKQERAAADAGFVCGKCWSQVHFIRPPFYERCGLPFERDMNFWGDWSARQIRLGIDV